MLSSNQRYLIAKSQWSNSFFIFILNKFKIVMFAFKVFLFVLSTSVVKSEEEFDTLCKNDYRDANNAKINVEEYCFNKLCIEKCCGKDEFTFLDGTCYPLNLLNKHRTVKTQYKAINILSSMNVNKTSTKPFYFIYNHRNVYNCTSEHLLSDEYEISEVTTFAFLAFKLIFNQLTEAEPERKVMFFSAHVRQRCEKLVLFDLALYDFPLQLTVSLFWICIACKIIIT